jgi:hypothetical protein
MPAGGAKTKSEASGGTQQSAKREVPKEETPKDLSPADRILASKSRAEAREYLDSLNLSNAGLDALGKSMGVVMQLAKTKEAKKKAIIDQTIGVKLDVAAIYKT